MRISDWSSDVCSSDLRSEVAREGADRLRARAVAAVHVERQADDEPGNRLRGDERFQRFEVGGELLAEDRLVGGREAPSGIAQRPPDRPGAAVEPGEAPTVRQRRGEAGSGGWGHSPPHIPTEK